MSDESKSVTAGVFMMLLLVAVISIALNKPSRSDRPIMNERLWAESEKCYDGVVYLDQGYRLTAKLKPDGKPAISTFFGKNC